MNVLFRLQIEKFENKLLNLTVTIFINYRELLYIIIFVFLNNNADIILAFNAGECRYPNYRILTLSKILNVFN